MDDKIKVVVVDDYRLPRNYFSMCIEANSRYRLLRSFENADDAVAFCDNNAVDLVVMDVMLRTGLDGVSAAAQIKKRHPKIKIVLATASNNAAWAKKAKAVGVESFWYKEYSVEPFAEVLDRTVAGESLYLTEVPDVQFGNITRSELTAREEDVLRELVAGFTNQEIADRLGVSINTVRTHIANILNKTGFESRLELAINASTLGLFSSNQPPQ